MTDPALVTMQSASFGYAGRLVVDHVTLSVRPGEVVALVGANGSGKSTLVRGLLGLADHLSGVAKLFSAPLSERDQRRRIGYVPQRHTLASSTRQTVEEVVATGRLPLRPWWRRATPTDSKAITQALGDVGLSDRVGEEITTLSGGQQRRVLIARALAMAPELLIMDEPTAGVDAANQEALVGAMGHLATRSTTMIVVTHDLSSLASVATRVVQVANGRLSFDGTLDGYAAFRNRHG